MLFALISGATALLVLRGATDLEAHLWVAILGLQCVPYIASILCQVAAYMPERAPQTVLPPQPATTPATTPVPTAVPTAALVAKLDGSPQA